MTVSGNAPFAITAALVKTLYPKRPDWCHKGDYGRLLVVGGSERFTGSPTFNALAAYRAGCDLVAIVAPRRAADTASRHRPDLIAFPLDGSKLERRHLRQIKAYAGEFNPTAAVIGCGLWREDETRRAVIELIKSVDVPMVVDADGIRSLYGHENVLLGKKTVLTPHANEFQQLTGVMVGNGVKERVEAVRKHAALLQATIVLKGHVDVVSDGQRVALNNTGSVFMTKGGFGDTLSGICGALLARGAEPFEAACAAAWINGTAGAMASKKSGEGVLAGDALGFIPAAIRKAQGKARASR